MKRFLKAFIATSMIPLMMSSCISSCSKPRVDEVLPPSPVENDKPDDGEKDKGDGGEIPVDQTKLNNNMLVGVDHFGRSFGTVDGLRTDRKVGMFYWPWIGQPYASGVYDATKIAAMPNGLKILTDPGTYDPSISPDGQAHFWGEPIWGYYNSIDEWVIRKQMQMLTMAGVDFIFFDHTNAVIYPEVVMKVCSVINDLVKEGWNPPRISSYTHSRSTETTKGLYDLIYKPNRYPDTWYRVDGKPMIIAYTDPADDIAEAVSRGDNSYKPAPLPDEILNFFHFYKPNWPFDPTYPDGFTWIEWHFPQPLHTESKMMNVTVASHPKVPMSFSLTRGWVNWGRGWDPARKMNISEDVDKGTFFQAEWDHAIKSDPPTISVGGWNEWVAYKQIYDGEYMLCDAASKEYSRDIEPMNGGYQDAFYLQLIYNIRRYKGVKSDTVNGEPARTIDVDGAVSQWNDVDYVVRNVDSKQMARDEFGVTQKVRYVHPAPKDRLVEIRVAHDDDNIYFYLKGKTLLSTPGLKSNWLNLFIGGGAPSLKGWEGYEFILGSTVKDNEISVETVDSKFARTSVGTGRIVIAGNIIQVSVSRKILGLDKAKEFYFKAAMDVDTPSDIMDYYKSGSAMPMGRLSYMYRFE